MEKEQWMTIQSVEELRTWGTLKEVKALLGQLWGDDQLASGTSFEQVFKKVQALQKMIQKRVPMSEEYSTEPLIPTTSPYFANEAAEYLFYLLELEGELRMKKLNIQSTLFSNPKKAKNWYRQIAKIIHPDYCPHPKATEGMTKLNELYAQMIGE